ncbi:hypothetical protein K402DRAFT_305282, partial [Aulographum hederae CBS 113979]
SPKPIQISVPLPRAPATRIQIHLTVLSHAVLLFLTTTSADSAATSLAPMGSFVYAMPSRNSSQPPISTPLYPQPSTLDFTNRVARIVARKADTPTYVGCSVSFASAGLGGVVEEEMEGLRRIVEVVVGEIEK